MAEVIKMPRLSDTMEEGVITQWHKAVGDAVREGDLLAEIETDKAVQEFESFYEGTLLYIGLEQGQSAPVDTVLAIIGREGEDISALTGGAAEVPAAQRPKVESLTQGEGAEDSPKASTRETAVQAVNATVIRMPRLSDTMEEGVLTQWHKAVGDAVREGDLLAEIETDKAVQEFESFYEGTLLYVGLQEGESAPVDAILAIVGPAGTDVSPLLEQGVAPPAEAAVSTPPTVVLEDGALQPLSAGDKGRIFASPLAKKMAKERGIDLVSVQGSGEKGRIVKRDIERFQASLRPAEHLSVKATATAGPIPAEGETRKLPVSQMRSTIAKRLVESKFTAPHYYLNIEVNMAQAMASRRQINALPDTKISFNDMVIKSTAMALRKHPQVNSSWTGDAITQHAAINIGVAVAIEDGLLVPVIENADRKGMLQLSAEVKALAEKSRTRKITPAEMQGSTFTISNLGMFGIESFTSIINQPDSCILSVGAVVEKPVVEQGQIEVGHTMKLTMACDHRTVDGATGAAFLHTLKTMLETPLAMML